MENDFIDVSTIRGIDITDLKTAEQVLAMQRESYKVEAGFIGTDEIPPLKESLEQLMGCGETFVGYFEDGALAGSLAYKLINGQLDIHRVMVSPTYFRKGIAQKLISHVENISSEATKIIVSTGAKNTPAVNLYLKFGFEKVRDIEVGNGLVLIQFCKKRTGLL